MRKGMSLPINVIVILAVAVIVLLLIVSFFASGTGQQTSQISYQTALTKACNQYKTVHDCTEEGIEEVEVEVGSKNMTLGDLTQELYGTKNPNDVADICYC